MTRSHLIARLIFAAMGVDLLNHFFGVIVSAILPVSPNYPPETFTARLFIMAAESVITIAASLFLLFRSDGLTRLIIGPEAEQYETIDTRSIIAGFRLTMCLCGLLILYQPVSALIPAVINSPKTIFDIVLNRTESPLPLGTLVTFIKQPISAIFGIYLIFGAPHYVRRQIKAVAVTKRGEK